MCLNERLYQFYTHNCGIPAIEALNFEKKSHNVGPYVGVSFVESHGVDSLNQVPEPYSFVGLKRMTANPIQHHTHTPTPPLIQHHQFCNPTCNSQDTKLF